MPNTSHFSPPTSKNNFNDEYAKRISSKNEIEALKLQNQLHQNVKGMQYEQNCSVDMGKDYINRKSEENVVLKAKVSRLHEDL